MLYTIIGLWKVRLVSSLIATYLLSKGLTPYDVMLGASVLNITLCIVEVPLGIFLDKTGTKTCLILSNILYVAEVIMLLYIESALGVVLLYFIWALERSLTKKCDIAVIGNKLEYENWSREFSKIYGNLVSISSGVMILMGVVCGLFYNNFLNYIITAIVLLKAIAVALILMYYKENRGEQIKAKSFGGHFVSGIKTVKDNKITVMFILLATITLIRVIMVDVEIIQMNELGKSALILSIVTIVGEITKVLVGKLSHRVISWAGKSTILILVGILGIMALLSLPNRIYMVAVGYYIAHVFDALKSVVYANEINRNTTISNRGTVTSFLFLVEGILISVVMVIVGKLHGVCGTVSLFKMILMFISIVLVPVTVKYIRANQEKVRMS